MAVSPLALKALDVGAVAVPAVGLGVVYREKIVGAFRSQSLSDFDKGLVGFLENGGDIKFKVTKGESDITDLNFSSESTSMKVSVKINVDGTADTSGGTLTESNNEGLGKRAKLLELNKNKAWSWTCEFNFTKPTGAPNELEDKLKSRIFDNSKNESWLKMLKEASNQDKKIQFIKKCADKRGKAKNDGFKKDEAGTDNKEIKGEAIKLELVKNSDSSKLVFKNNKDLDYWFPEIKVTAAAG